MDKILNPVKLPLNVLPTNLSILQAYVYEKEKWCLDNETEKEPASILISQIVANQVQIIYKSAQLETVNKPKIIQKIGSVYKSRIKLLKIPVSKRSSTNFSTKMKLYNSYLSQQFEIGSTLSKPKKISKKHGKDMKSDANVDVIVGSRAAAKISRQKVYAIAVDDECSLAENVAVDDEQNDAGLETTSNIANVKTKKLDLSEIVEVKSRYSGSDRYTAAIVNATLRMVGMPASVDKNKLRRARDKLFVKLKDEPVDINCGVGLYYDSRKDATITSQKRMFDGKFKFYRRSRRLEHYSLVSQPEGTFLGFIETEDGTALCASRAIVSFSKEKKIFQSLQALGSDGTNVNVGADGGINHYIEVELERPLHWFVCLLHANELPLKKLITTLDGKTSGSKEFSGPIGKLLNGVCDMPVVAFKKFGDAEKLKRINEDIFRKLSNDQKYLYNIVNALITGHFPESLVEMKIGNLNHSRWVTTASRICKLYASTPNLSATLKILTTYIVEVYTPVWFRIKENELAVNGPENLFFLMKKSNTIKDENSKAIVQKCIRRNAFFAHSENVLLAQLASDKKRIRSDAVRKILNLRQSDSMNSVRLFKVPELNFLAKSWTDIGILNKSTTFEPPFTSSMTEEELLNAIDNPLEVPGFKCHTQMVERAVKEVTRVSQSINDHDQRNSMVKATLMNRFKFPKFDSLKDHSIENEKASILVLPKI